MWGRAPPSDHMANYIHTTIECPNHFGHNATISVVTPVTALSRSVTARWRTDTPGVTVSVTKPTKLEVNFTNSRTTTSFVGMWTSGLQHAGLQPRYTVHRYS